MNRHAISRFTQWVIGPFLVILLLAGFSAHAQQTSGGNAHGGMARGPAGQQQAGTNNAHGGTVRAPESQPPNQSTYTPPTMPADVKEKCGWVENQYATWANTTNANYEYSVKNTNANYENSVKNTNANYENSVKNTNANYETTVRNINSSNIQDKSYYLKGAEESKTYYLKVAEENKTYYLKVAEENKTYYLKVAEENKNTQLKAAETWKKEQLASAACKVTPPNNSNKEAESGDYTPWTKEEATNFFYGQCQVTPNLSKSTWHERFASYIKQQAHNNSLIFKTDYKSDVAKITADCARGALTKEEAYNKYMKAAIKTGYEDSGLEERVKRQVSEAFGSKGLATYTVGRKVDKYLTKGIKKYNDFNEGRNSDPNEEIRNNEIIKKTYDSINNARKTIVDTTGASIPNILGNNPETMGAPKSPARIIWCNGVVQGNGVSGAWQKACYDWRGTPQELQEHYINDANKKDREPARIESRPFGCGMAAVLRWFNEAYFAGCVIGN